MKLTRELLEVMDSDSEGQPSILFDYFKVGGVALWHVACVLLCRAQLRSLRG
jgi:hypothetical protein